MIYTILGGVSNDTFSKWKNYLINELDANCDFDFVTTDEMELILGYDDDGKYVACIYYKCDNKLQLQNDFLPNWTEWGK